MSDDLLADLPVEDRMRILMYRNQARFGRYALIGASVAVCVALVVAKLLLG